MNQILQRIRRERERQHRRQRRGGDTHERQPGALRGELRPPHAALADLPAIHVEDHRAAPGEGRSGAPVIAASPIHLGDLRALEPYAGHQALLIEHG